MRHSKITNYHRSTLMVVYVASRQSHDLRFKKKKSSKRHNQPKPICEAMMVEVMTYCMVAALNKLNRDFSIGAFTQQI